MQNVQLEKLKDGAFITLSVSSEFYLSLLQVMLYLADLKDKEEADALAKKLQKDTAEEDFDDWELALRTMMILCAEIEIAAKDQDLTETVEIPVSQ